MRVELFVAVLCLAIIATGVECRRHSSRRHHRNQNSTAPARSSVDCPAIDCPDQRGLCPYGPNQDEHNCPMCGCRASRRCDPRPMCMMHCPEGFQNGPDGCPVCRCYTPPTVSVDPFVAGNRTTSRSQSPPRPQQHQDQPSVGHHVRTKSANETAAPSPALMSSTSTGNSSTSTCPPICLMYCEHGFKRDRRGCSICECNDANVRRRSSECLRPQCLMYCENGYQSDARGCLLCQCFEPGSAASGAVATSRSSTSTLQCPRLRCHSRKTCAFGFEVDQQTGCQSCTCRPSSAA